MSNDLRYKIVRPDKSLADFVDSFWLLQNLSSNDREVIILPDGRIDLIVTQSPKEAFHSTLLGIGTHPDKTVLAGSTLMYAVSFKLPAAEYILHNNVSGLLDSAENLPDNFWDLNPTDLKNFDLFCRKVSQKVQSLLPGEADTRKLKLFELIYSSNGSLTVQELSEKVFWSSRQINRYFNQHFGLPLKAYCNILRFRASFRDVKEGKLFPAENFSDQSHFIKEVKKLSGALPKELRRNQNDRFIQFSTLALK